MLKTSSMTISMEEMLLTFMNSSLFSTRRWSTLVARLSLLAINLLNWRASSPSVKVMLMLDMKLWLSLSEASSKNLPDLSVYKTVLPSGSFSGLMGLRFK